MFDDPDIIQNFLLFVVVPALLAMGVWYWAAPQRVARRPPRIDGSQRPDLPPVASPSVPVPIILDRRDTASTPDQDELARRDQEMAELRLRFDKVVGERTELAEQLGAATQRIRELEHQADELRGALGAVRAELVERDEEIERLRLHERALEALRRDTRRRGGELVEVGAAGDEAEAAVVALGSPTAAPAPPVRGGLLARDRAPGDGAALGPALLAQVAMAFDGTTGPQVAEAGFDGLSGAGFTIEMWVRPAASTATGTLLSYVAARQSQLVLTTSAAGELELMLGGQRSGGGAAVPLEQGQWQHLALCWEAETGGLSLYIDGEELFAGELARGVRVPPGGRLLIGQDANPLWDEANPGMSFVGDIAEVRIWRYVRTGEAIARDLGRRARGGPGATIWRVAAPAT